jgi:hypothetical protein
MNISPNLEKMGPVKQQFTQYSNWCPKKITLFFFQQEKWACCTSQKTGTAPPYFSPEKCNLPKVHKAIYYK